MALNSDQRDSPRVECQVPGLISLTLVKAVILVTIQVLRLRPVSRAEYGTGRQRRRCGCRVLHEQASGPSDGMMPGRRRWKGIAWMTFGTCHLLMEEQRIVLLRAGHEPLHRPHDVLPRRDLARRP
jgi:hypothetical protein